MAFHPYEIAASNLEDREEAVKVIEGLIQKVNRTWERREELAPDHEMHRRPTPLEVYKLMPGTNCKECGQSTCYVFAIKLAAGQVALADCPSLQAFECAAQLAQLQAMVGHAPAIG